MRVTICTVLVWLAASLHTTANAQAPLTVDIENWVIYNFDVSDPSRLASNPAVTPPPTARNFISYVMIADITAVGGKPVKGLLVRRGTRIDVQTAPMPGQAIGDVTRGFLDDGILEFLQTDGTPIGTITVLGFIFGPPPPGAPVAQNSWNMAVTGGTGAFLGARGQMGGAALPMGVDPGPRIFSSAAEDPSYRRIFGGRRARMMLHLVPLARPEILTTSTGPEIFHGSDFSPVSATNPARRGEVLIISASGLGPTRQRLDPGTPFPAEPLFEVNSPVEVRVNGVESQLINKVGWPGRENIYRVDFRVPEDTTPGVGILQLTAAWIPSSEVQVPIR
jgi:hypothetical protein